MARHGCRTVLVVVSSDIEGTWLTDVLSLLAGDCRTATFFTVAPYEKGMARRGVAEFLRARGCPVLPWRHAVRHRFDLVVTAGAHGLAGLWGKAVLSRESAPAAGDLCYDRLLASIPFRAGYRRALGLSRGQKLVVMPWTRKSTVDSVLGRLVRTLPPERYRVAALVSPDVWCGHGGWQVRTWLADLRHVGLLLPRPNEGWRGTLVAANLLVGDMGMALTYGAAIGVPVLLTSSADGRRRHGVAGLVSRHAPRLRPDRPLLGQVENAMCADRAWQDQVAERIAPRPGYAGDGLRRRMYELLNLSEPTRAAPCHPVPLPRLSPDEITHHSIEWISR